MSEWARIFDVARQLGDGLMTRAATVTTAESCTGGGIAFALTSVSGSSDWFNQAEVTYSNESKASLISVSDFSLSNFGAVSEQVAAEMALGAALKGKADFAVATTGLAGPGGGSDEKPVGTVCFGWCCEGRVETERLNFKGDRHQIRMQTIEYALKGLLQRL
jgi:nicotinamide-nucleotide amidase